jgi:hypothetical protein
MKKALKILMVVIMILGIAFSVTNFISLQLKAAGMKGIWVYDFGTKTCEGLGNECDITIIEPN